MKSPFTGKEMTIQREWRTMSFRKDEFKILFHSYKCEDTGEQFEDDDLSELNFNQLVNQYREKYSIPFPDEIIAIRNKYDLSAVKMSEILGFGINSYRQYESGEVPSQSNARLIQLADDPKEFWRLVELCNSLEQRTKEKISARINTLHEELRKNKFEAQLIRYFFGNCLPSTFTGHKMPNLSKFTEMVVFFANHMQPWKTKLNKLLFYADFTMYKQTGYSISGVSYRAIPMGPVPNNFNTIYEYLANKDDIDIAYTEFPNGSSGEQFFPNSGKIFNNEIFNSKEILILESIAERFEKTSTEEIIDLSHKEKAWIDNNSEKKIIDYNYSFELN